MKFVSIDIYALKLFGVSEATVHVTTTLGSINLEYLFWRAIGNVNGVSEATVHVTTTLGSINLEYLFWRAIGNVNGVSEATVHVTTTLGSINLEYLFWRAIGNVNDIELPAHLTGKRIFLEKGFSDADMEMDIELENGSMDRILDDEIIECGDYLLVRFLTKKRTLYYTGLVEKIYDNGDFSVNFLRRYKSGFHFPNVKDVSKISRNQINKKLPRPTDMPGTSRTSAILKFDVNFFSYNVQ
ncbi:hypothetical protein FQA39_LY01321 [Lamprigera yunnana]|nr:hypothetical protein FQA39_LY01321 [Lamprigera yunnana]